ncbi:peroxisomal catalase [Coprinopsis marcescibilis]|uniref:Catalase n=1 Tax=Coprinopsis marcescibilis TaxID=230819 RepID=A0A5C3KBZ6_COPMA|nr:peroxisomal catalase [Coprinopsis marcescibilis]
MRLPSPSVVSAFTTFFACATATVQGSNSGHSFYTTSGGVPVNDPTAFQRVGRNGPILLQDTHLIEQLAHFARERIPERVVHAKGAGAYGVFEVTEDITDLTSAAFLDQIGKKSRVLVRFSTVGGESGSADTARDPRGFAIKIYTEEGNEDWVFNSTPVFFLRDPSKFPLFVHTQKRDPQTHLKNATVFWDYLSTNQESVRQLMHLFSDRGTPFSYRHMDGFSGHTFKFAKHNGTYNYVKIHLKTDQGVRTLTNEEAGDLAGKNSDWTTQDLFEAIQRGDNPSWTAYVQVMSPEQAEQFRYSVFDLTKTWPEDQFPLRKFGKMTLNQNPENFFAEIEQAAFSPSNIVPGIEPSADPVLQARLFSYPDSQRYRLGVNFNQIPVNCPMHVNNPFQRDGHFAIHNYGAAPNYMSSFHPLVYRSVPTKEHEEWVGKATLFSSVVEDKDFEQATEEWAYLGTMEGQQRNFVHNIAVHLCNAHPEVRKRTYGMFDRVDAQLGQWLREETEKEVVALSV